VLSVTTLLFQSLWLTEVGEMLGTFSVLLSTGSVQDFAVKAGILKGQYMPLYSQKEFDVFALNIY
jgi:hypothetical protein